ncbi:hypothetical protein CBOM_06804 [Ceraceosorus bombacis]|uniref:Uncharacterized protein n=1 Tax=Ceraceosorus bombacis TaxID=401625 RepID=A0A0P1BTA4_9BASI|nr:hypothetical protein CBOM_06804 [Ceraceosorus bombacis]
MRALFRRPSEQRHDVAGGRIGGYAEPEDLSYAQAIAARGIGSSRDSNGASLASSRLRSSFDGLSSGAHIGGMPPPARPASNSQVLGETRKAKVLGLGSKREKTRRRMDLFGRKNTDAGMGKGGAEGAQSKEPLDDTLSEAQWRTDRALAEEARTWRGSTRRSVDREPIVVMGKVMSDSDKVPKASVIPSRNDTSAPHSPILSPDPRLSRGMATSGLVRPWDQYAPPHIDMAKTSSSSSASSSTHTHTAARANTGRRAPPPPLTQIFADGPLGGNGLAPPHRPSASVSLPHSPVESSMSPRSPSRQRSIGSYGSAEPSPSQKLHARSSSHMASIRSPLSPGSFRTATSSMISPLPSSALSGQSEPIDTTARLAQQLNELAIAHGDGLLGEEEYRKLRAAAFSESGVGNQEVPREARLGSFGGQLQKRPATAETSNLASMDKRAATAAPSLRSQRSSIANFAALFRKGSLRNLHPSHGESMNVDNSGDSMNAQSPSLSKPRSIWTAAVSVAGLSRSDSKTRRAPSEAELESEVHKARSARTLGGANGDGMSAKHSITGAGSGSVASASGMLTGDYAEKGANELKAEMAVVEAEQKKLLEAFNGLVQTAVGRSGLGHEQLQRAQNSASRALSPESSYGSGDKSQQGAWNHSLLRKSSTSSSGSKSPARGRRRGLGDSSQGDRESAHGLSPSYPPSAFRHAAQLRGNGSNGDHAQLADDLDADMGDDPEEEVSVRALRNEIVDIGRRREDVRRRYEERLAFLRSLVRSATLREGLRK